MKFRLEAPPPRPGFTLTEVLMAMFVMALGMISLLALFPAGFINARWALDNEQVSRAAANGQAMTEMPRVAVTYNLALPNPLPLVSGTATSVRNDDNYRPDSSNSNSCWQMCANIATASVTAGISRDTFLKMPAVPPATNSTWTFSSDIRAIPPAYLAVDPSVRAPRVKFPPVFVDPFIADTFVDDGSLPGYPVTPLPRTNLPLHVGANDLTKLPFRIAPAEVFVGAFRPNWSLGIPRFSLKQYQRDSSMMPVPVKPDFSPPVLLRKKIESSMSDEIDFGTNGQPNVTNNTTGFATGTYASQSRFTWAYMCQWPDFKNPDVCDVTEVIFNSRPNGGGLSSFPTGEYTYGSSAAVSAAAIVDSYGYGRVFVKGMSQAVIKLTSSEPIKAKAGDWILDSTMILPDFNSAFPNEVVPFLDEYSPAAFYQMPPPALGGSGAQLRPGLVGGHFYKVLDVSPVKQLALTGESFQIITLDRPARSDGFSATYLMGIADVISKGVGRMPQR